MLGSCLASSVMILDIMTMPRPPEGPINTNAESVKDRERDPSLDPSDWHGRILVLNVRLLQAEREL